MQSFMSMQLGYGVAPVMMMIGNGQIVNLANDQSLSMHVYVVMMSIVTSGGFVTVVYSIADITSRTITSYLQLHQLFASALQHLSMRPLLFSQQMELQSVHLGMFHVHV
jgi:hypothetical protein